MGNARGRGGSGSGAARQTRAPLPDRSARLCPPAARSRAVARAHWRPGPETAARNLAGSSSRCYNVKLHSCIDWRKGRDEMALTREDVRKVALLARLELTDEEIDAQARHLNGLLAQFEVLQHLDVTGVEPTSHSIPLV